jgi:superfamily II DNA/RNA helicase
MGRQFKQLDRMPRLIVATPGRLNDHLKRKTLNLQDTAILVLDETDRMLDMGFGIQIEAIRKFMPEKVQTLLFSATLPHNIVKLSGRYLANPLRIAVGSTTQPIEKIKQEIIRVAETEKHGTLIEQINKRTGSIIIFVKTKYGTERLARKLNSAELNASAIHGDLQQRKRERVIQAFRDKQFRILVATDVAARGLDIPHIEHVINFDLPQCPEDYIHRIGRTARNGEEGEAIALITPADQGKWRAIVALMPSKDQKDLSLPYEAGAPKKERGYSGKRKGGGKKWEDRKHGGPKKEWHAKGGRPNFEKRGHEKKDFNRSEPGQKKEFDKKEFRQKWNGEKRDDREFSGKRNYEDRQPMTNENRDFSKREFQGKRSFGEKRPFNRDGNRDGNRSYNGGEKRDFNGNKAGPGQKRPFNKGGNGGEKSGNGYPPKPHGGRKWQGQKKEWHGSKPHGAFKGDRKFGPKDGNGGKSGPRGAGKPWQGKPRRPDAAVAG